MESDVVFDSRLISDEEWNELLEEQEEDEESVYESLHMADAEIYLFYDDRTLTSNVEDIDGGDNFADYCEEFFNLLDEVEYFDN